RCKGNRRPVVKQKPSFFSNAKSIEHDSERRHAFFFRDERPNSVQHSQAKLEPDSTPPASVFIMPFFVSAFFMQSFEIHRPLDMIEISLPRQFCNPNEFFKGALILRSANRADTIDCAFP